MAVDHNAPTPLFLGAFYCEEVEEEGEEEESKSEITSLKQNPLLLHEFDSYSCWDDDEHLQSLLIKEREQTSLKSTHFPPCALIARKQAVEIILRIRLFHGFSASAAVLAVNYLDRFLFNFLRPENHEDKPWLMQLVAVACLSLAAKVEETHVPLLADLQAEDAKYLFEAKTVQRMEVLILSALEWRMNPATPISFIDHIVRRLGFKSDVILLEFLKSCENTILSVISDSRIVGYLPSVVATASMLNVVHRQVEYYGVNGVEYEKTMFQVLKISKKEVEECYGVIQDDVVSKCKIWELSRDSSSSSSLPLSRKQDLSSHTRS